MKEIIYRHKVSLVLLVVIGFVIYFPSLFGSFLWDDEDFVIANQYVANFQIDKFFTESVTAGRGKISNYYRPLQSLVYSLTHIIFGFNPFWYHLLSVSVHIAAAITIFYFLMSLTKVRGPSFIVALIFLIHPIQTEAVSYISGMSDSLYVFFGFLSLIAFLKKRIFYVIIFFALSIFSKETGIVFSGIIFLLSALEIFSKKTKEENGDLEYFVRTISLLAIFIACYLFFHFTRINQMDMKVAWGSNSLYANNVLIRLATWIQNLPTYFTLLLFPKDLFMERDYTVAIATSVWSQIVIFFSLNLIFIASVFKIFKKSGDRFGLFFFYFSFWISFVPYSGFVLINGIFYEHFLYLPLVWFFSFWIFLIILVLKKYAHKNLNKAVQFLIIGLLVCLGLRNIVRQFDWSDSVRFYKQTLQYAPKSVRINNGLAMEYASRGETDRAINQYKKTIQMNPTVPNLYHNLGNSYLDKGNYSLAEENYLKALEVDPNFYYSLQSLINLYTATNQKEKLDSLKKRFKI